MRRVYQRQNPSLEYFLINNKANQKLNLNKTYRIRHAATVALRA